MGTTAEWKASKTQTPWGVAQDQKNIARGIIGYATAGHGGIHVSKTKNQKIHQAWREYYGWYEEDCAYAIVTYTFPEYFSQREYEDAVGTLKRWYWKEWEEVTGEILSEDECPEKRRDMFLKKYRDDWIVISAIAIGGQPDKVEVHATRGGILNLGGVKRVFHISKEEYHNNKDPYFLVDPSNPKYVEVGVLE